MDDVLKWWGLKEGGGDPITGTWPCASSVVYPASAICVYLYLVATRHKKEYKAPANIRSILLMYNLFQILLSAYIFMETLLVVWHTKYNFICEPPHSTQTYYGRRMAIASWLFHISKYIDVLDTYFMVVKGNKHQLSVLHIFHHSSMIMNSWFGIRHAPTGHSFFIHLANSFVHVCMYSYYFFSSFGSWIRPYLWWKPYLTQVQIIQFFLMFGHMGMGLYNGCPLNRPLGFVVVTYLTILIVLFLNFYIKSYLNKNKKEIKKSN